MAALRENRECSRRGGRPRRGSQTARFSRAGVVGRPSRAQLGLAFTTRQRDQITNFNSSASKLSVTPS